MDEGLKCEFDDYEITMLARGALFLLAAAVGFGVFVGWLIF